MKDVGSDLEGAIRYAATHSPFYEAKFSALKIDINRIRSTEDLRLLPFTTPDEITHQSGRFRVDTPVTIYGSSGTTGRPKYSFFTPNDLARTYQRTVNSLQLCGVRPDDVLAVAHGFGIWLIGTDFTIGAQQLGATVLPVGKGPSAAHVLEMMVAAGATILATSPSYGRRLAVAAEERGISLERDIRIRALILSGESISPNLIAHLRRAWRSDEVFSCYGSAEFGNMGCESRLHDGVHLYTDDFIFEVVDLDTHEPIDFGDRGELVVTSLGSEGMPLVRYRTGDVVTWARAPLGDAPSDLKVWVHGRLDDALVLEAGEKLWPHQCDAVMARFSEVADYQIIFSETTSDATWLSRCDDLRVLVVPTGDVRNRDQLAARIEQGLAETSLDFSAIAGTSAVLRIEFADPEALFRTETGKTPRFVDRRQFPTIHATASPS